MAPSLSPSDHWLSSMCCIECKQTPDESPVYICSLGHTVCLSCYTDLARKAVGVLKCSTCNTTTIFTPKQVSEDFLKKLKTRPGIGRPYRYGKMEKDQSITNQKFTQNEKNKDEEMTVEKLFQMPTAELQKLFEETSKRRTKLTALHSSGNMNRNPSPSHSPSFLNNPLFPGNNFPQYINVRYESIPGTSSDLNPSQSSTSLQSRKPIRCPHDPCNKIIAMSSFQLHFKHEHTDIAKITIDRGQPLRVNLNSAKFEFNKTICLVMVTISEKNELCALTNPQGHNANIARRFPEKVIVGTYWLMMSGSQETKRSHAYMLFWLFTNEVKEQSVNVNCTLELSSENDEMAFSTFCSVNVVPDDLSTSAIAKKLHCLYVTYGGLESLLTYGPKLILRLTVH